MISFHCDICGVELKKEPRCDLLLNKRVAGEWTSPWREAACEVCCLKVENFILELKRAGVDQGRKKKKVRMTKVRKNEGRKPVYD